MENLLERCVFLFGRQRSGTTVLRRALASHPLVKDLGEIMHPEFQKGFYSQLQKALSAGKGNAVHNKWFNMLLATIEEQAKNDDANIRYIIDIKYNMAHAFGIEFNAAVPTNALLNQLRSRNAKVMHLARKNKLELLVSERVAMKTNQWEYSGASEDEKKQAEVHVSPVTLGLRLQKEIAQDEYFAHQTDIVSNKMSLVYEEMFTETGDFQDYVFAEFAKLTGLSQDEFEAKPLLKKQRRAMSESISNYPQVRRAIEVLVKEGELPDYFLNGLE